MSQRTVREWTHDDESTLLQLRRNGLTRARIATIMGRTTEAIKSKLRDMHRRDVAQALNVPAPPAEPEPAPEAAFTIPEEYAGLSTPTGRLMAANARIRDLEAQQARLSQQLTWAQRADARQRTGGLLTLRASDHHYADANHLLACGRCLEQKFIEVIRQYEPDNIQIIAGDDWVVGRGVYPNQDLDVVIAAPNYQLRYGAIKGYRLLQAIREVSSAPIVWRVMHGNHDTVDGTSLTSDLAAAINWISSDIPNLSMQENNDSITANLAATGTYNVLVKHGSRNSEYNPQSPRFIRDIMAEIVSSIAVTPPHERVRRVLSGHLHWASLGYQYPVDLFWDTTGGLQRNTRIRLGANQRPIGWLVYVGLPELDSDILQPILLYPDRAVYDREVADPDLREQNCLDVVAGLRDYAAIMRSRGALCSGTSQGRVTEGR